MSSQWSFSLSSWDAPDCISYMFLTMSFRVYNVTGYKASILANSLLCMVAEVMVQKSRSESLSSIDKFSTHRSIKVSSWKMQIEVPRENRCNSDLPWVLCKVWLTEIIKRTLLTPLPISLRIYNPVKPKKARRNENPVCRAWKGFDAAWRLEFQALSPTRSLMRISACETPSENVFQCKCHGD